MLHGLLLLHPTHTSGLLLLHPTHRTNAEAGRMHHTLGPTAGMSDLGWVLEHHYLHDGKLLLTISLVH